MDEGEGYRHRSLPERDRNQHSAGLHPVHEHPCPGGEHDVGRQIGQKEGRDRQPRARQIVNPDREGHRREHVAKRRQPHGDDDQTEVSFFEQQVRAWVATSPTS